MIVLQFVLIAVTAISSVLLVILILLQKTKADGLGLAFGAGVGEALFGSRAGNILSKLTIALGCVFLASTLLLSILFAGGREKSLMGRRAGVMAGSMERAAPAAPAPTVPQAQPQPAAPPSGAPTLPGADLGDQGLQQQPAPAATPAPQPAPAPVQTPAP